jgi:DNA-binding transcriptional MerR regulator
MTPRLYKAADVCEMAQLQPYVLRSWEKEFPGIGVQKTADGQRLYRQADVDQVLRIKQLVFGEGLTLAGARRRLEDSHAAAAVVTPPPAAPAPAPIAAIEAAPTPGRRLPSAEVAGDARARIDRVREGLRSILTMIGGTPPPAAAAGRRVPERVGAEEYQLASPPASPRPVRKLTARRPEKPAAVAKRKRATA